MTKRRPGRMFPLELDILQSGLRLQAENGSFYGFSLARELADHAGGSLTAHGTLYKALSRLKDSGLLEAAWEDAATAEADNRPRRRLYQVSAQGELALSVERIRLAAESGSAAAGVLGSGRPRATAQAATS